MLANITRLTTNALLVTANTHKSLGFNQQRAIKQGKAR